MPGLSMSFAFGGTENVRRAAVLFLAATGHAPFTGDTWQSLLVDVLSGKRTPPSHYDPSIPPALEALIARAMAHDPARNRSRVRP